MTDVDVSYLRGMPRRYPEVTVVAVTVLLYVFAVGFSLFRTYHLTRSSVATESSTEE